ncbi:MAG: helix-turn-helix transcriptional regulator [Myxococcales bacterium]|nr:helix-turn-helix transcriptional regulator [Myxococcales bacterium]
MSAEIQAEPSRCEGEVLLTRAQAARRIGVSVSTIRRMEGAELEPVLVDGKHLFHLPEVDRYRRVTDGELAARAFQMFNDGRCVIDVVIELQEPPERIEKLHERWCHHTGSTVVLGFDGKSLDRVCKDIGPLTPKLLRECIMLAAYFDENRARLAEAMKYG